MWKRITEQLRSPVSGNPLTAVSFGSVRKEIAEQHLKLADDMGVSRDELSEYIVDGVLLCESDKTWYPIIDGLPVLLPYRTRYRDRFSKKFKQQLTNVLSTYSVPDAAPAKGEKFILTSFSEEWKDYDYDGVIWELDYADQRRRLKAELDLDNHSVQPGGLFLEVGCGLGITTVHAQQLLGLDVFGVDLSLASHRAVKQFEQNPFIHFIQASLFHLPFERETFEVIYSRGVLHHTYSTEAAFKNVATYCKSGGRIYVWVYGDGSIDSSFLRKILYQLEKANTR